MKISRQTKLFLLCFFFVVAVALFVIFLQSKFFTLETRYKGGLSPENDKAVIATLDLYKSRAKTMDLENGPCLTNDLIPGWVADVVHSPRDPIDDLPENQCQAYLEGRAKHFVEIDVNGNIIRVK